MDAIFMSESSGRARLKASPVKCTFEDHLATTHLLMVPATCEHFLPGEYLLLLGLLLLLLLVLLLRLLLLLCVTSEVVAVADVVIAHAL